MATRQNDRTVRKISATRDYSLFTLSKENRLVEADKHRKLRALMEEYGFLSEYPILCIRDRAKKLVVIDGQHRLLYAEELGLPVYYIITTKKLDVAKLAGGVVKWTTRSYAEKYAANGSTHYKRGLEYVDLYGLPVGVGFAMLGGTTSLTNIQPHFNEGEFKIRDMRWAEDTAELYYSLYSLNKEIKSVRLLLACMAVCRIKEFSHHRMVKNAKRCREKLIGYSTREAYLEMMQNLYNYRYAKLVPLKTMAEQAMRSRNAAENKRKGRLAREGK